AAYDAYHQQVIVFGGSDATNQLLGDTWELDNVVIDDWVQLAPAASPSPRLGAAMVYDAVNQRLVMFGGLGAGGVALAETWVYDGAGWTRPTLATSPPLREGGAMALDWSIGPTQSPANHPTGAVVLVGGSDDLHAPYDDVWQYDGLSWQPTPAVLSPEAGSSPLAYDAARREVLLATG